MLLALVSPKILGRHRDRHFLLLAKLKELLCLRVARGDFLGGLLDLLSVVDHVLRDLLRVCCGTAAQVRDVLGLPHALLAGGQSGFAVVGGKVVAQCALAALLEALAQIASRTAFVRFEIRVVLVLGRHLLRICDREVRLCQRHRAHLRNASERCRLRLRSHLASADDGLRCRLAACLGPLLALVAVEVRVVARSLRCGQLSDGVGRDDAAALDAFRQRGDAIPLRAVADVWRFGAWQLRHVRLLDEHGRNHLGALGLPPLALRLLRIAVVLELQRDHQLGAGLAQLLQLLQHELVALLQARRSLRGSFARHRLSQRVWRLDRPQQLLRTRQPRCGHGLALHLAPHALLQRLGWVVEQLRRDLVLLRPLRAALLGVLLALLRDAH